MPKNSSNKTGAKSAQNHKKTCIKKRVKMPPKWSKNDLKNARNGLPFGATKKHEKERDQRTKIGRDKDKRSNQNNKQSMNGHKSMRDL